MRKPKYFIPHKLFSAFIISLMFCCPLFANVKKQQYVIIISIDGWAWFHMKEKTARTPNIDSIISRGVLGYGKTVFPSMTWPTHTSMITGARPVNHGVVGNEYLDRKNRKVLKSWEENGGNAIRVKTICDIFKEAGLKTAALIWPMSRGVKSIDFNIPELYDEDHFNTYVDKSFQQELRAANIPVNLLNKYSVREEIPLDALTRDIAVFLIKKHKPNLLLVHFNSLDTWEHYYGPRSPQSRWALEITDLYIGDIVRSLKETGIDKKTTIFLTADHGFCKVNTKIDINQALYREGIIKTPLNPDLKEEKVWTVPNGHMAYVYLLGKNKTKLIDKVYTIIKKIPNIEKIYTPKQYLNLGLPLPGQNQHAGDLVILSRPDSFFGKNSMGVIATASKKYIGMHGYLPEHKDMYISFAATGYGIKKVKKTINCNLIDIAPTVLKLFELQIPSSVEGKVLQKALR